MIRVLILDYPGALQMAVAGIAEMLTMAERFQAADACGPVFQLGYWQGTGVAPEGPFEVVILPPATDGLYYRQPTAELLAFLQTSYRQGSLLCSACVGSWILAEAGLLNGRRATTHWLLADELAERFPQVQVEADRLLVDEGDILTAAGLMAWVDMTLALIGRFCGPSSLRQLGRYLVTDTGPREQQYYRSFTPVLTHGDSRILQIQQALAADIGGVWSLERMAALVHLSQRTLIRRFEQATGLAPNQYLQRLRIQLACDRLEATTTSVSAIALASGYQDLSSFRKTFRALMGLGPSEFRQRFSSHRTAVAASNRSGRIG